jgi:hypothetical protein
MSKYIDEIKNGGIKGCLGLDQIDWGGNEIYGVWRIDPCCSSLEAAGKCVVSWWLCGPCSMAKLYGKSMGQDCSIIPGCLCVVCAAPWVAVATRYGMRKSAGNICGDCVCCYLLGPCAACQVLRSASVSDWWLLPPSVQVMAPSIKVIK